MTDPTSAFRTFTIRYPAGLDARLEPVHLGNSRHLEAIAGEAFIVAPDLAIGDLSGTVASAPPGSESAWTGSEFRPDLPGRYKLMIKNGAAQSVTLEVVAFPPEALDHPDVAAAKHAGPGTRSPRNRRVMLRSIVQGNGHRSDGPITDAEYAALSPSRPIPVGVNFTPFQHAHSFAGVE